ncbi:MAG: hypothetical protein Q8N35_17190 [Methylococcaceae bacterium]|nr:hypothetical protein [Methylococcaceae bacterium]MDZ4157943.1 hypothetical protein [Methylococcales bacterium]MDP2393449.1 hypothetical protein [Methylococcaceae bacterium]MDP3021319.1 hypothetical protein [Methylococcaceae bacterium]MDP3391090.1 hypothetical protein [Methylococcaceae bacterium]
MKIDIKNTGLSASVVCIEHGYKTATTLSPEQSLELEIELDTPVIIRGYTEASNNVVIENKSKLLAEIERGTSPVIALKAGKTIELEVDLMSSIIVREQAAA